MSGIKNPFAGCTCWPGEGCWGESEPHDPKGCDYCRNLDGEMPCPGDPECWESALDELVQGKDDSASSDSGQ